MARRRSLSGTPLLVASASGLVFTIGCGRGPTPPPEPVGNLVAPPSVQLCVDVTPPEATLVVNGSALTNRCTDVYDTGTATVDASAPGYEPKTETVSLSGDTTNVKIDLVPSIAVIGNLMPPPPPPPPPPVGNLMPPPPPPPK